MNLTTQISDEIIESIGVKQEMLQQSALIAEAATLILDRLKSGGKLLAFGNGGSAGDAQHIVAEFVGRYRVDRKPLPAIALTTNTSSLTAIGNDYDFSNVFARQIEALATPADVVLAISTSGNSANVLRALMVAEHIGAFTIGLTGRTGGKMRNQTNLCICVPSDSTPRIQEVHILIGHLISGIVEDGFTSDAVRKDVAQVANRSGR